MDVTFYTNLNISDRINLICGSSYYHLGRISNNRRYLGFDETERLIHAFISCRLDYCKYLLYGLPKTETSKPQRVRNAATRILTFTRRRDHILPVLMSLHWSPVDPRIVFKIYTIVYECLHWSAPSCLIELLETYNPVRELRSASQLLLTVRKSRTKRLVIGHSMRVLLSYTMNFF